MVPLFFLMLFATVGVYGHDDEVDCCFADAVKKLAPFDRSLNGRLEPKQNLVRDLVSKEVFINMLTNFKTNGTTFACGYTRSWVAEIMQGLGAQYEELKARYVTKDLAAAGYQDYKGNQRLISLFEETASSNDGYLFLFQIVDVLDHVWLVEQLPKQQGYRIYQSYNGAYSLHAWLTKNPILFDGMYGREDKPGFDIIYWQQSYNAADNFLKYNVTQALRVRKLIDANATVTMENFESAIPEGKYEAEKNALRYIRDYSKAQTIGNLRMSWNVFGSQRALSKNEFFFKYLNLLNDLIDSITPMVSTAKLWTQKQNDDWITLFGSPNPLCMVGMPFNDLTFSLNQNFELQVKKIPFTMNSTLIDVIESNANILLRSVDQPIMSCDKCRAKYAPAPTVAPCRNAAVKSWAGCLSIILALSTVTLALG